MNDFAIKVENLSKVYKLYDDPVNRLKESLHPFRKKYHKDFYALKNVSFEIKKGETVGIIGRNGSGKSTFLKLIAGVLTPSTGNVYINGKISALLELGAGFNPELTGIENIYFNATLMGYTREEIDSKLDEVLLFADIGDFIYQPVKAYSSGMFVRLAFAVAISIEPEILIVDEALAVGDEAFQRKCFSRIHRIKEKGGTILLVSHSAAAIVELCDRAILIDAGEQLLAGSPKMVVSKYHRLLYSTEENREALRAEIKTINQASNGSNGRGEKSEQSKSEQNKSDFFDSSLVPQSTVHYTPRGAYIEAPHITTMQGEKVNTLNKGAEYIYTYKAKFLEPAFKVRLGSMIKTVRGLELGGLLSHPCGDGLEYVEKGAILKPKFRFKCNLAAGVYFLNAGVVGLIGGEEVYLHRIIDAVMFRVQPEKKTLSSGIVDFSAGEPLISTYEARG